MSDTSLSGLRSRWVLPPPLPDSVARRYPQACRSILQAFVTRKLLDETTGGERLRDFLDCSLSQTDPFQLRDMDRAVDRILLEIDSGRPIGVFGHFDCDGVTATALLCEALTFLGATAIPHIPGREDEYGIPPGGVHRLRDKGVRLIVTVDCGIRAHSHVAQASALGVEIIITDHHQCDRETDGSGIGRDILPAAFAVVNPRREDCPSPFKHLAGVGVAYRLAGALAAARPESQLANGGLEGLLDLVCLGTVADVVDLVGENRRLVARGLVAMRERARPGILSLMGVSRVAPGTLTARTVAFALAPRINAAQRIAHGKLSLDLLQAGCCEAAAPIALELERMNRERRELTARALESASLLLAARLDSRTILVAAGEWSSGISGLVASQLKEIYGKPALAIALPADSAADHCVGSARSVPGFDITAALTAARQHLVRFGGHSGAAGFTVLRPVIPALEEDLDRYAAETLDADLLGSRLIVDGEMGIGDLRPDLWKQIERFEPCGQGNPAPLFLLRNAVPLPGSVRIFSDGGLSCGLAAPAIGPGARVTVSGRGQDLAKLLAGGSPVDLVCQVPVNSTGKGFSLRAQDARPSTARDRPLMLKEALDRPVYGSISKVYLDGVERALNQTTDGPGVKSANMTANTTASDAASAMAAEPGSKTAVHNGAGPIDQDGA